MKYHFTIGKGLTEYMPYPYYGNPYYPAPMQDNLAQLRQPMMQQLQPVQQNPVAQNGVQWVNGEMEARNWMIAPNSAVALWDSMSPTVYLKQADASGKPSLKIYDLVERAVTPPVAPQNQTSDYVTRKEFDELAAAVAKFQGETMVKEEKNG